MEPQHRRDRYPSRKVIGKIDFDHGVRPHCPVFDRTRGLLYVTTELDQTITIIDPKTLKIIGTYPRANPNRTCWRSPATAIVDTPLT